MEDSKNYYIDLGKTQGILPKDEIIPGEKIIMGSNIKVYITKVDNGSKGCTILLSRCHYGFVKRLFELEIPEVNDGTILVHSVARDAGNRTKVAVESINERVDAIGSCIGEKGMRIANILKELNGEKVDLVLYSTDPSTFIINALSPAKNVHVFITDEKKKEALCVTDKENLSLAIGKKGMNIKLAARLTHYKIDVKTFEEAKKIPMRSCVITREKHPKQELIRVVRGTDGNVYVDQTGKLNGRGAYLKKDIATIEKAKKTGILNKILEVDVPESIYEELKNIIG